MVMKVSKRAPKRVELQDDRQHHHGQGDGKARREFLVGLRALLELAADIDMVVAGEIQRLQAGLDRIQASCRRSARCCGR